MLATATLPKFTTVDGTFPKPAPRPLDPSRQIRNLALVGFMGTGKTSVGHIAATLLGFGFVDTDEEIEKSTGMGIVKLFEQEGEARFRELERQVVRGLEGRDQTVISTGGGLILNPANLESLKTHALVVCLWASPESIYARVSHQTHRPLLNQPNPLEKIRHLLAEREPFYRKADLLLASDLRTTRELAQHVALEFRRARLDPPGA